MQQDNGVRRGRDYLDALRKSETDSRSADTAGAELEVPAGFTRWNPTDGIVVATFAQATPSNRKSTFVSDTEDVQYSKSDRLRPREVGELISTLPKPWIIRNLLPERAFGVIYGEPASGKTFLVLDIAAAVARGTRWRDLRVRQGGVIYVACEGTLTNRLRAYLQHHGLEWQDLSSLRIIPSALNLLGPDPDTGELIHQINDTARDVGDVALVVIDTLNRAMSGGDENTSVDMGKMIAAATRITESTGASVIFVHHCGKDIEKGARGHSSLKAAVDFEMAISCGTNGSRCATATKIKDGEPGIRYGFRLVTVDLGVSRDPSADPGEHETSCVIEATDAPVNGVGKPPRSQTALAVLRKVIGERGRAVPGIPNIPEGAPAVELAEWKLAWCSHFNYAKGGSADSNFGKDKKALVGSRKIGVEGKWVWVTDSIPS